MYLGMCMDVADWIGFFSLARVNFLRNIVKFGDLVISLLICV